MFRSLASLILATTIAACGSTAGSTAGAVGTTRPTTSATPITTPAATLAPVPSATAAPVAIEQPRATSTVAPATQCASSATGTIMSEPALLVGVRVGTHDGYDRVVFEFASRRSPSSEHATFEIGTAKPPFYEDPSGRTLTVSGNPVLSIVFRGATIQTLDSRSSYSGSRDFQTRFPVLTELKSQGDFEAVNSWLAGLSGPACVKAQLLSSPTRVVVDLTRP